MKIKLNVCVIFDTEDTWESVDSFETDLAKMLLSRGLLAEKVQSADDENYYLKTIFIFPQKQEPMVEKQKSPKDQKKDLLSKFILKKNA